MKQADNVLHKQNEWLLYVLDWALYAASYKTVLNQLVGVVDSSLNKSQQPIETKTQGWGSWALGKVMSAAQQSEAVQTATEIMSNQERRENFLTDPATIQFLKDKRVVPGTFFENLKTAGVINRLVTSHDQGTALHIAGKLLQDQAVTTPLFALFNALDTEEIENFIQIYYSHDRPKILSKILENPKLQANVQQISKVLAEKTPELIELTKLFLTKPQQKALDRYGNIPEILQDILSNTTNLKPEHFKTISDLISSEPIRKILNAKKEEREETLYKELPKFLETLKNDTILQSSILSLTAQFLNDEQQKLVFKILDDVTKTKIDSRHLRAIINLASLEPIQKIIGSDAKNRTTTIIQELPKLIRQINQRPELQDYLKDTRLFALSNLELLDSYLPEEGKKYLNLLQDENFTKQVSSVISAFENKELHQLVKIFDSKDPVHAMSALLKNRRFQVNIRQISSALSQNSENILSIAKTFMEQQSRPLTKSQKQILEQIENINHNAIKAGLNLVSELDERHFRLLSSALDNYRENQFDLLLDKAPKLIQLLQKDENLVALVNNFVPQNIRVIIGENPVQNLADIISQEENLKFFQQIIPKIDTQDPLKTVSDILDKHNPDICSFIDRNQKLVVDATLALASLTPEAALTPTVSNAISSIVKSIVADPGKDIDTPNLLYHINALQKEKDPQKISEHSSAMTQGLVKLFTKVDLSSLREIYKDPTKQAEQKQVNEIVQKFCDSWGIEVDSQKLTKFAIKNQKNIDFLVNNKDTGILAKIKSVKILTFMVAQNPTIVKIFNKNKNIYLSYKKPKYKTQELETWIKDSIDLAKQQEPPQEVGSFSIKIAQEKYKDNKLVKFYAGNFAGVDFSCMNFSEKLNFSNSKMDRIFFNESDISSSFAGAEISSCSFAKCKLSPSVSFEGAKLENVSFDGAHLSKETIESLQKAKMDDITRKSFEEAVKTEITTAKPKKMFGEMHPKKSNSDRGVTDAPRTL
jgi:hypothetical protein